MDQKAIEELLTTVSTALKEIDKGGTGLYYIEIVRDWFKNNAPEYLK